MWRLKQIAALVVSLLMAPAVLLSAEHTKDTVEEIQKKIADKKAILVDVREQKEWDEGHIEGAVLVPLSELEKRSKDPKYEDELIERFPKDRTVYCHCRAGRRALLAVPLLEKLGYEVRAVKPGFEELIKAGFKKAAPEPAGTK